MIKIEVENIMYICFLIAAITIVILVIRIRIREDAIMKLKKRAQELRETDAIPNN